MPSRRTYRLVLIALLSAMSLIAAKFFKFPIFPAAPFLKMDFGEIPLLLAAFLMPLYGGVLAVIVKELLSFTVFGTNIFAITANIVACGTFILVFSLVYKGIKKPSRIAIALLVATLSRGFISIPLNLIILPLQYGMPIKEVWAIMIYIVPFNFIKATIDGICTWQIFRLLKQFFHNYQI